MKYIKRGHTLTYDPFWCFGTNQMGPYRSYGPYEYIFSWNASRGVIGEQFEVTKMVSRGPTAPRDICCQKMYWKGSLGILWPLEKYFFMKCVDTVHKLTYDPFWDIQTNYIYP